MLLTFTGFDQDKSEIRFEVYDSITKETENLTFSLKWWQSFIYHSGGLDDEDVNTQNSGDYIFRPETSQFKPFPYSKYQYGTISNGKTMDFHFFDDGIENATVHVSIDSEFPVLKFDVDLGSIPGADVDGYEVVVEFHVDNFDNNNTFYSDSNGLEMQKRILNYRPTWDL